MSNARLAAVAVALWLTAAQAIAEPPMTRAPLGEAIRETLIATPALLAPLSAPEPAPLSAPEPAPINLYADDIARDLDLLAREAPHLFAPGLPGFGPEDATRRLALFTAPDCPDCAQAEAELRALAGRIGLRVNVFDLGRDADLAARLGLDMAPSYVLPDRLLRGAMPAFVLERYLAP